MSYTIHMNANWPELLDPLEPGRLCLTTYSLPMPHLAKLAALLKTQFGTVQLVAHESARVGAELLKATAPNVAVRLSPSLHAKLGLFEPISELAAEGRASAGTKRPKVVIVSTGNLGASTWSEVTVRIESNEDHDRLRADFFEPLWLDSVDVLPRTKGIHPSWMAAGSEEPLVRLTSLAERGSVSPFLLADSALRANREGALLLLATAEDAERDGRPALECARSLLDHLVQLRRSAPP